MLLAMGFVLLFMAMCAVLVLGSVLHMLVRRATRSKVQPAPRTCFEGEKLNKLEEWVFYRLKCPDCGAQVVEGPHGGMSVNYFCTNAQCGSRFNFMGPFGIERISNASPQMTQLLDGPRRGPYR